MLFVFGRSLQVTVRYGTVVLSVCNIAVLHGWMDQDATWSELGLDPGDILLDGDPDPPWKGYSSLPSFRPTSVMAKRSPISATAELLVLCYWQIIS